MTRKIQASEVKSGMEVQFDLGGWDVRGTVARVKFRTESVWIYTDQSCEMSLDLDDQITVLSEPAPVQPEEPTEFGAKVVVFDRRFLRLSEAGSRSHVWHEEGTGDQWAWEGLCAMGLVTVIPDQGWTVPADGETTPEVPDTIDEWPEDDTHLWAYRWEDRSGWIWKHHGAEGGGWTARRPGGSSTSYTDDNRPCDGPWTRVSGHTG